MDKITPEKIKALNNFIKKELPGYGIILINENATNEEIAGIFIKFLGNR